MTYNEWRDELKSNLLCVSESERRRVLDYYAEAYADRRDAGFTEREIIEDFGAPYDAAQRILSENSCDYDGSKPYGAREEELRETRKERREREREEREERERERRYEREEREREREERERERRFEREEREREEKARRREREYHADEEYHQAPPAEKRADGNTFLFVLLCIILAGPIFSVAMAMIGITIGLVFAPFVLMVSGVATFGTGIGGLFSYPVGGAISMGVGLVIFGVSLIIMPFCFQAVKWMWKLFRMFFAWLKKALNVQRVSD